jgi:hypothetical protein
VGAEQHRERIGLGDELREAELRATNSSRQGRLLTPDKPAPSAHGRACGHRLAGALEGMATASSICAHALAMPCPSADGPAWPRPITGHRARDQRPRRRSSSIDSDQKLDHGPVGRWL